MTKQLLATTALAAIFAAVSSASTTPVFAADLAVQPAEPVAPIALPYDWTGPYVGLHIGGGWGRETDNLSTNGFSSVTTTGSPAGAETVADHFNVSGFVAGAHAGYNYQIQQFVVGAEGDFDYADLTGSHRFSDSTHGTGILKLKTDWQASLRARAGYAFDNILLYATGGVAFANAKLEVNGVGDSNTHTGWTAGGGVEYAFTPNWIARVEVRYSDFGKKTYQTPVGPVRSGFDETSATVGISYKF